MNIDQKVKLTESVILNNAIIKKGTIGIIIGDGEFTDYDSYLTKDRKNLTFFESIKDFFSLPRIEKFYRVEIVVSKKIKLVANIPQKFLKQLTIKRLK